MVILTQQSGPRIEDLAKCVHCGFCLQSCPTYLETGLETESPRGRLSLMRARAENRITATERFREHMDLCLSCRNCEAVCPSGVPYGRIMEAEREQLATDERRSFWQGRFVRSLVFDHLLPHPNRLHLAARLLRFYQRSGLQALLRKTGLLRLLPPSLQSMESLLPRLPDKFFAPSPSSPTAENQPSTSVALLTGCVMPYLYPGVHEATVRVLERNGRVVTYPTAQTCCGALHLHSGEREKAKELARRNIDAFFAGRPEAIIVNAAGCGATMKEYGELLKNDPAYAERAGRFSERVRDISEYLATLDLRGPLGEVPFRVTYQDSCHLAHVQRVTQQPRALLCAISGLDLREMAGSDRCCGSAGVYNVTQHEMSQRLLASKIEDVDRTGAEVLITANPGCMLQLELGLREVGKNTRVVHVVEVLDWAYQAAAR